MDQQSINLTFKAPESQSPYRIDAWALDNELGAALGNLGWSTGYRAHEVIVDFKDESMAAIITATVEAHIANTEIREANNAAIAHIVAIESTVTPRMLREAALGNRKELQDVEDKIAPLRTGQSGAHTPSNDNYRALIRRRAKAFSEKGNEVAGLLLLKTIGD